MDIGLLIDNSNVPSTSAERFERKSPTSGTVATTAAAAKKKDVDAAVDSAAKAFPAWSAVGPGLRRKILNDCADALEAKTDEFVALGKNSRSSFWIRCEIFLRQNVLSLFLTVRFTMCRLQHYLCIRQTPTRW